MQAVKEVWCNDACGSCTGKDLRRLQGGDTRGRRGEVRGREVVFCLRGTTTIQEAKEREITRSGHSELQSRATYDGLSLVDDTTIEAGLIA